MFKNLFYGLFKGGSGLLKGKGIFCEVLRGVARCFPRTPLKNKNKNKKIYKYIPNVGKIPSNT